ncbi:MAG: thymidylate synthase (FAD) [Actinomycetes bacterium]|jgi:thymidylate synthase (FAD)
MTTEATGTQHDLTDIEFRNDMTVDLIRSQAADENVVWAARVSTAGDLTLDSLADDPTRSEGLIRYLLRSKHGTPFEHNSMIFFIRAPIFVFREFMRHRIGWSYNEESARYRELAPTFYVPAMDRPLVQEGKPGHYQFVQGSEEQSEVVQETTKTACESSYRAYQEMLAAGVAREVARGVLPVATYSSMYATCNARSLMSFLSLRVHDPEAANPSFPQREIEMVATQLEAEFARVMPITYKAFLDFGRVAP